MSNAKQLAKLIQTIVRQEITEQITELKVELREVILGVAALPQSKKKTTNLTNMIERSQPNPLQSKVDWNSGNVVIDSVMTETLSAPNFRAKYAEYADMMLREGREGAEFSGDEGVTPNTAGVDPEFASILTRDYGPLVKKMLEKK